MRTKWSAVARVLGAVGMVLALCGCVVVPAYPRYGYWHPYRYYYYP